MRFLFLNTSLVLLLAGCSSIDTASQKESQTKDLTTFTTGSNTNSIVNETNTAEKTIPGNEDQIMEEETQPTNDISHKETRGSVTHLLFDATILPVVEAITFPLNFYQKQFSE